MTGQMKEQLGADRELASLAAASVAAGPVPAEVVIVPWGEVASSNGSFTVDGESARLVVERFEAHGCDLPIDYEHQTLGGEYTSPTGQAPAAGWIKRLEARPGQGIIAHVLWTDPAAKQLAARQYRYLSPVAIVRKSDRKLVALHSVALTNKPAIVGMTPIVNAEDAGDRGADDSDRKSGNANTGMRKSECGTRDGDPPQADPATARASETATGDAREATAQLRRQLALDAERSDAEVLVVATRRLTMLEEEGRRRQAEDSVAAATADGKLAPAQRDWAIRLCLSDEPLFDEYVRTSPLVVRPGRLEAPPAAAGPAGAAAIATRAQAEYRSHPALAALTSEEAYVAEALRARQ